MSLDLLHALYAQPSLQDLGEKLAGQLRELAARPTLDRCDRMVRELSEASTAVARMRAQLERAGAA